MTGNSFRQKRSAAALLEDFSRTGPLSAMIEVADRCNENCVHCYQVQGKKGELSTEGVLSLLDELASMGVLFVTFSGGEATLRDDFLELVAHARKLKFAVKVYSNGLRIDESYAAALGRLAVQEVQMSLYSPRSDAHDWVTRVAGSWQKTVDAARHLRLAGVKVVLKTPVMRFNEAELSEYIELCQNLNVDYSFEPIALHAREDGERSHEVLSLSSDARHQLMLDPRLRKVGHGALAPRTSDAKLCGAAAAPHIEPNGEVRPCTVLQVPLGTTSVGVAAAYNSEAATFLRTLTWNDVRGCRNCELNAYCSRCHSTSLDQVGDMLAPYPAACLAAKEHFEARTGQRSPTDLLGPFQRADLEWVAVEAEFSEADLALRVRYPWLLATPTAKPDGVAQSGVLVKLRRPGKKEALERVPFPTKLD